MADNSNHNKHKGRADNLVARNAALNDDLHRIADEHPEGVPAGKVSPILKEMIENSQEFIKLKEYQTIILQHRAKDRAADARLLQKDRADFFATRFRDSINRTNTASWHKLFNHPLWGGVRSLTVDDLKEVEQIAIKMGGEHMGSDDGEIGALFYDIQQYQLTEKESEKLLLSIKGEWLLSIKGEWNNAVKNNRAGNPADTKNLDDLVDYFYSYVLPQFEGDNEAQAIAIHIGQIVTYKVFFFVEQIVSKLRLWAGKGEFEYIVTSFNDDQLRGIYGRLADEEYIEDGKLVEFMNCFDGLATAKGKIYWKGRHKNGSIIKEDICSLLGVLEVKYIPADIIRQVRSFFWEYDQKRDQWKRINVSQKTVYEVYDGRNKKAAPNYKISALCEAANVADSAVSYLRQDRGPGLPPTAL